MKNLLQTIVFTIICCNIYQVGFAQKQNLVVGSYTKNQDEIGLRVYEFDSSTGKAQLKSSLVGAKDPSYLLIHPTNKFVYTVNESAAKVSAYAYDSLSGKLTYLNQQDSKGDAPCYISTDKNGKLAIVANYSGGSLAVFPIQKTGKLASASQVIAYEGAGPDKERQAKPHIHSTILSPDDKIVAVSDLGTDKIELYNFNPADPKKALKAYIPASIKLPAGGGPRHVSFSANGRFLYSIQEMTANISVIDFSDKTPAIIQNITMLKPDFKGTIGAADIHLSADGKFLYATNRGDANEIGVFAIDQVSGKLTLVEIIPTLGKGPRNFVISPNDDFILIGHQYTNNIIVFKRDKGTGKLTDSGERIEANAPVCLKFGKL